MKSIFRSPLKVWLTGLITVLPLLVTIVVISWIAGFVQRFIGPESVVGRLLVSVGLPFGITGLTAWLLGVGVVVLAVYFLGLILQGGMQARLQAMLDSALHRVPLVGGVYELTNRFVGVFGRQDQTDLKTMSPVWCFFGGDGGTAVLGLLPNPNPITLSGHQYYIILVPSAPVPVGGGLLCVPAAWIKRADFGVETFTNIYVSMGVSIPASLSGKLPLNTPQLDRTTPMAPENSKPQHGPECRSPQPDAGSALTADGTRLPE